MSKVAPRAGTKLTTNSARGFAPSVITLHHTLEHMAIGDVLEEGTLGFFWPLSKKAADLENEPERGYAKLEEGWVALDVLDERPMDSLRLGLEMTTDAPTALLGALADEAAMFLEVIDAQRNTRFGGSRASSKRYLARTAIGGVPVDRLRTPSLQELHAHFHGIGRWAGMSATKEDWDSDDGRVKEWSVTLSGSEDLTHPLTGGRELVLSTTWRVDGPTDRRTISAPVSIGFKSHRPVDVWELLQPILQVQDLLSFTYEGFVAADGGSARLDLDPAEKERHNQAPTVWNGALMVRSPVVTAPRSVNERSLFHLETIGGIAGLARWTRLSSTHPRATRPLVARYRQGRASAALTVMEVAAAIEYWAKANRPAVWADSAVKNKKWVQALADRCGKAFADWVGGPEPWAKAFWGSYNRLKHEPTFEPDALELTDLAESARYLLGAVMLDRVALTKTPSRSVFKHYRLDGLGARLRDRYA
ncbi:MAG: hypothetical protein M3P43_13775 [Actinomycetota bacterium]|nr:hypothetical protein [Actinomycetota bacterium]